MKNNWKIALYLLFSLFSLDSFANKDNTTLSLPVEWQLENDTSFFDNMVFIYDSLGLLIAMENQSGQLTRYEYNDDKKLNKELFANGTTIQYAYNELGKVRQRIDENGDTTNYIYTNGRLVKRDYPGDNDDYFVYNKIGKISLAYNKNATIKLAYDDQQRLISEELNGQITRYLFSENNRIKTIIYPNNRIIQEHRDRSNRLTNIFELRNVKFSDTDDNSIFQLAGMNSLPIGLQFDADTLASFKWENHNRMNNLSYPVNRTTTYYKYFDEEHLQSIQHSVDSNLNQVYSYGENDLMEIYSQADALRFDYQFNNRDQLTSYQKNILNNPEFSNPHPDIKIEYDDVGNRTKQVINDQTTEFISDDRGAYTAVWINGERSTIKNDKKGNLIDDGVNNYTYDSEGRLIEVNSSVKQMLPGQKTTFQYDPFSRRIAKVVDFDTISYYYAGDEMIGVHSNIENTMSTYVYNSDLAIPLNMQKENENYFFHHDRFGSITTVSNNNGSVVERYEYHPDGSRKIFDEQQSSIPSSNIGNLLSYQGMEFDVSTGLYYYEGAYLKKDWGRSITRKRFATGFYQEQNPVVKTSSPFYENLDEFKYCESELGCGSTEEPALVVWANSATKSNGFVFKDGKEFIKRLEDYSDENCCVDFLIVISHGWGWPRTKGSDVNGGVYGSKWVNGFLGDIPPNRKGKGFKITTKARQLSDLEKRIMAERINFCAPCEIILTGCRVASTGDFVERLARLTGCKVTASHGGCDGTNAPYFSSRPKTLKERESGEYKGFSITYPDGSQVNIGDLLKLW